MATGTADLEGELAAEMLRILAGMGVVPSTSGGLADIESQLASEMLRIIRSNQVPDTQLQDASTDSQGAR